MTDLLFITWLVRKFLDVPHELLVREYTIKEEGYVFMYVSNTSPVRVYFDDVKFTYTPTNVIQYNEYYPFGLQTSNSWTRAGAKDNDYLYNAGSELNNTTGWYEMFFRGYDPTIGRMLQVDPLAASFASYSTYNYALNNPVLMNDPNGDRPVLVAGDEDTYTWRMPDGNLQQTPSFPLRWSGMTGPDGQWYTIDFLDGYYTNTALLGESIAYEQDHKRIQHEHRGTSVRIEIDYDQLPANSQTTMYFDGNGGYLSGFQVYSRLRRDILMLACTNCDGLMFAQQGPAWDLDNNGRLSLSEANNWYRNGNGVSISVPLHSLNLQSVHTIDFTNGVGSVEYFSLFLNSGSVNDALVFGSIGLRLYPNNTVRAFNDTYNFEMHNPWNPLNWPRNTATVIGEWVAEDGIPFQIIFTGSATISPESTRSYK